jgi:4-alpha-glucanotransferase
MNRVRSSGVLLHPTSLPDGRLGKHAYRFVDWLAAAGQSWWQVLPLGPPDSFGSPYNAVSAFASSHDLAAAPRARVAAAEIDVFRERHAYWIDDYARFAGRDALADQVRFDREWRALREYAAARGVRLIGDVPIFVSHQSVDVHAKPELFLTSEVAAAAPDFFAAKGQLWGSALYDWRRVRLDGYRWWIERFRRTFELVDLARVDHFRGFVAAWAVKKGAPNATRGRWQHGPGAALFHAVEAALGQLPLIAEDLGVITPAVRRLRDDLGLPGMRISQHAFFGRRSSPHRLENHTVASVAYTGSHDNDTAIGWWRSLTPEQRRQTGLDPEKPSWSLIRFTFSSPAFLAVVPMQDVLGLGSRARMNQPGTTKGNWRWRLEKGQLTDALAECLRDETAAAGRLVPAT